MRFDRAVAVTRDLYKAGHGVSMAGRHDPEHGEHFSVEVFAATLEHAQIGQLFRYAETQDLRLRFDSQRVRLVEPVTRPREP